MTKRHKMCKVSEGRLGPTAVGLHREIEQTTRVSVRADADGPSEHGPQLARQHGQVELLLRPAPEAPKGLLMEPQQLAAAARRHVQLPRQPVG